MERIVMGMELEFPKHSFIEKRQPTKAHVICGKIYMKENEEMKGKKIPVEVNETFVKDNGNIGHRVLHSYVALLTEKDGSEVKAVRLDQLSIKKGNSLNDYIQEQFPDWNIKGVWRLYEDDFRK